MSDVSPSITETVPSLINDMHDCRQLVCKDSLKTKEVQEMLATVLIVILVLALLGVLPRWNHSRSWGYYPTGGLGLVLLIVVVLLLMGRI